MILLSPERNEYHKHGANLSLAELLDCKDATMSRIFTVYSGLARTNDSPAVGVLK